MVLLLKSAYKFPAKVPRKNKIALDWWDPLAMFNTNIEATVIPKNVATEGAL